jgi:hypothetical protein
MTEVLPVLEEKLESSEDHIRQGSCIGLAQVLLTAGKQQVEAYANEMTSCIRQALLDASPEVRESAAQAFDALVSALGPRAVDDIVPALLSRLRENGEEKANALESLKEILAVRGSTVFPVLIPSLTTRPMTSFHAQALGALIEVAGAAVYRRLSVILDALIAGLLQNDEALPDIQQAVKILVASITDSDGLHSLMIYLHENVKNDVDIRQRGAACYIMGTLCESNSKLIMTMYLSDWIRILVGMLDPALTDGDQSVVDLCWKALEQLVGSIKKDDLVNHIGTMRRAILSAVKEIGSQTDGPVACIGGFNRAKASYHRLSASFTLNTINYLLHHSCG